MKVCSRCGGPGPFYKRRSRSKKKDMPGTLSSRCKKCSKEKDDRRRAGRLPKHAEYVRKWRTKHPEASARISRNWRQKHLEKCMWKSAKSRATAKGIDFCIVESDIEIPERCPLLGLLLSPGDKKLHASSPTLDRKDPKRGYVPDNVWVISHRANTIKNDATLYELILLANNLAKVFP